MSLEFKEAPPPAPDAADRRVLDAQVQLYREELRGGGDDRARRRREVPQHARLRRRALPARRVAVPGARLLLGAPLPPGGGGQEQRLEARAAGAAAAGRDRAAHRRLRERRRLPQAPAEPAAVERWSRASRTSAASTSTSAAGSTTRRRCSSSIPATNPYYFQARYFLATILVKRGDLAGASTAYDDLLKQQAPDDTGKDIQDLARLAIARIFYERSQFDKAIEVYLAVPRQSQLLRRRRCASRPGPTSRPRTGSGPTASVNLLLLYDPDTADAPDLRLLDGEPRAAHEQLLPGQRRVQQGARRVRADPPPAPAGHRQVADRSGLLRLAGRQEPRQVRHRRRSCRRPPPSG